MPNKKGHRVAASRDRAREAAKKKARQTGPAAPPAITIASVDVQPSENSADTEGQERQPAAASAPAPERAAAPAASAARTARGSTLRQRREQTAMVAVAGASVSHELMRIGVVMGIIGLALVVLKLATPLGA